MTETNPDKIIEIICPGPSLRNYYNRASTVYAVNTAHLIAMKGFHTDKFPNMKELIGFWMDDLERLEVFFPVSMATLRRMCKQTGSRFFTSRQIPGKYPTSLAYPLDAVLDYYKLRTKMSEEPALQHFLSTPAYIPAYLHYADIQRYYEIHIHGCDFFGDRSANERANFEYWLGIIIGLGHTVRINPGSMLCDKIYDPSFYGYTSAKELAEIKRTGRSLEDAKGSRKRKQ